MFVHKILLINTDIKTNWIIRFYTWFNLLLLKHYFFWWKTKHVPVSNSFTFKSLQLLLNQIIFKRTLSLQSLLQLSSHFISFLCSNKCLLWWKTSTNSKVYRSKGWVFEGGLALTLNYIMSILMIFFLL